MQSIIDKKLAILQSVMQTADSITNTLKDMPHTGKKGRNVFVKACNRRPQNKKKRDMVIIRVALSACFGATDLSKIIQTPIPRYPSGGGGV